MSIQPDAGRAQALAGLHAEIATCRACQERGYLLEARPLRGAGEVSSHVMLVGQAPGALSDAARRHFTGPAGDTLERWFDQAGFPPGYFREQVYLSAVTRCFPGKHLGGKGDRVPSPAERALCRPFLERELDLVEPSLILLVGTLAIEALLGKLPLAEAVGRLYERDGRQLLPLPHSSPVSRWLNDAENRRRVDRTLELLAEQRVRLRLV